MWELQFRSLIADYKYHVELYTDKPKTRNRTGKGFVDQDASYSWTFPKTASVYTAELHEVFGTVNTET